MVRERRRSVQLFILTLASVYLTYGFFWAGGNPLLDYHVAWESTLFSAALMTILLAHEMAHYFVALRHGFALSLPFFIPFPLGIGTLGAIIRLRSPPASRTALLEMGAAGPIAGALVAFIMLALGLPHTEPPMPLEPGLQVLIFNDPWIVRLLGRAILGAPPDRYAVFHPVALAGWFGCLLTAINLLPVGQLDGGHILHALVPRWARWITRLTLIILIGTGVVRAIWYGVNRWLQIAHQQPLGLGVVDAFSTGFAHMGLGLWGILLLVLGVWRGLAVPGRPPLTRRAWVLAGVAAGMLILTFLPIPFDMELSADGPEVAPQEMNRSGAQRTLLEETASGTE